MNTNYDETTLQITNHPYWIFIKAIYQDELLDRRMKSKTISVAVKCLSTITNIPCYRIYKVIHNEIGL